MFHFALVIEESVRHLAQRFFASARAGTYLGSFRRSVRFRTSPIDQNGVLLLRPAEPSFGLLFVPAAFIVVTSCAALGFYS